MNKINDQSSIPSNSELDSTSVLQIFKSSVIMTENGEGGESKPITIGDSVSSSGGDDTSKSSIYGYDDGYVDVGDTEALLVEQQQAAQQMQQQERNCRASLTSPCVIVPLSAQEELMLSNDQYQVNKVDASKPTTYTAVRNLYPQASYENTFPISYTKTAPTNATESQLQQSAQEKNYPSLLPVPEPQQIFNFSSTPSSYQQFLDQVHAPTSIDSSSRVSSSTPSMFSMTPPIYPPHRNIYDDPFGFYAHAQQLQQESSCMSTAAAHSVLEYQRMWDGTLPLQYPLQTYVSPTFNFSTASRNMASGTVSSSTMRLVPTTVVQSSGAIVDSCESAWNPTNIFSSQQGTNNNNSNGMRVKSSKQVAETVTSENQQAAFSSRNCQNYPEFLPKIDPPKLQSQETMRKVVPMGSSYQKKNPRREYLQPKYIPLDQFIYTTSAKPLSQNATQSPSSSSRRKDGGSSRRKSVSISPVQQKVMKYSTDFSTTERAQQPLRSDDHQRPLYPQLLCDNVQPSDSHDNNMTISAGCESDDSA